MSQALKTSYLETLRPKLQKELGLDNLNAVPRLTKITINTSSRDFKNDKEFLEKTKGWFSSITGQAPSLRRSKTSIAAFNLREGDVVGMTCTLRGDRCYDFFQKLTAVVLPRIKDFQGVSRTAFDQQGSYTIGLREQIVFPEVEYDKIGRIQGLEITISSTANNKEQAFALLQILGMPFAKPN